MKWLDRHSLGLIGQIVAILLLALGTQFGISTLLYERASQFSVQEDEAHRLAEHLVIGRRLIAEASPARRAAMAAELTTDRYAIAWQARGVILPATPAPLFETQQQIIGWEPALADSDLRLGLINAGRRAALTGDLALRDGSRLRFKTRQPLTDRDLVRDRILITFVPVVMLMLLGGLMIRRTLLPLKQLARAAERFDGAESVTLPEAGPAEVRGVTQAFNTMQARIRRLISERTEALAAVGHDLRTPLARLKLRADSVVDADVRDAIALDVKEMTAMIASLLAFLGGDDDPDEPEPVDVAVLISTIVDAASDNGHAIEFSGLAHLEMVVRPVALKRAIGNLVDNAAKYAEHVSVSLAVRETEAVILVEDDGPGIAEAMLAKVVEPFVRLDDARRRDTLGLGLGLSIVQRSVAQLGGRFRLSNRPTGGLRAEVVLPGA